MHQLHAGFSQAVRLKTRYPFNKAIGQKDVGLTNTWEGRRVKIAIVGAGLVGRLAALACIQRGDNVTVFEAHSFHHPINAAAISAGMIAPISESIHVKRSVVELGFASQGLWPEVLNSLGDLDPHHQSIPFDTRGTLAISFPEEQECLLTHREKLLSSVPEQKDNIRMLYNDEVGTLEPDLDRFETAIYVANESNVGNREFLESSTRAIQSHASIVDHWPLQGDGAELQPEYDFVIDCRGAGAVHQPAHESEENPLIAVRGEAIRVKTNQLKLQRPIRVIQQRFSVFIVPKSDNTFVVGATDLDKQGSHAVTVKSSLDLLSAIYALHPGFANAEIIEAIAGQRAVYAKEEPRVAVTENIVRVNGLSRQGWMVGPAMTQQIMEALGHV